MHYDVGRVDAGVARDARALEARVLNSSETSNRRGVSTI